MSIERHLALVRLLQLVSPSLPVGGFTYSQGLEWAVERGWVGDVAGLHAWAEDLLNTTMVQLDAPILVRLYRACDAGDWPACIEWSDYLLASRETSELRAEERNRGRALTALLPRLGIELPPVVHDSARCCQLTGFAFVAQTGQIPLADAVAGYLWSWLENIVLAGVKIIPLGQSDGQALLTALAERIPELVEQALAMPDSDLGATGMAQVIASCRHETQYTRIYRS